MKYAIILSLALIFCGGLSGCISTPLCAGKSNAWGSVTNGMRMCLAVLKAPGRNDPGIEVSFQNAGERDVSLNLGYMLANGKVQLPAKIHLRLTDHTGRIRELDFADKKYGNVSGRVDDYVVPLRSGSTYTLELRLDQFWSPGTQDFDFKVKPGHYAVSAQFEGVGAETGNSDLSGMNLMNFWKGKLQSNDCAFVE